MSIISFKNINLKLRRAFELLSVFYNVLEKQNTLMIQQEVLLREVKQIYNLPGKSEPTLIRYIDFLAELGLISVRHEFIRRGFVRKFIAPTVRGVILSYIYGIKIPELVYRYAAQEFQIIDYLPVPEGIVDPLELTFDKIALYIFLLESAAGTNYSAFHEVTGDLPFFFNKDVCLNIISRLTSPIKEVRLSDIINVFPNKTLKESLKEARTIRDVKVILEKELLWFVLAAIISRCSSIDASDISLCLDNLKDELPYRDIQIFIGVMNRFWSDLLGENSFIKKFIELMKGRDPELEQQLWNLYKLLRKMLGMETQ